jgi:hypothetical protein
MGFVQDESPVALEFVSVAHDFPSIGGRRVRARHDRDNRPLEGKDLMLDENRAAPARLGLASAASGLICVMASHRKSRFLYAIYMDRRGNHSRIYSGEDRSIPRSRMGAVP